MICIDFKYGPFALDWHGHLVTPEFLVRPTVIKVAGMALFRPLSVASECDLTITAAEHLNDQAGKRLNAEARYRAMKVGFEDSPARTRRGN